MKSDIPLEPPLDRFVSDGKRHHLTSNETGCLHITHLVAMDTREAMAEYKCGLHTVRQRDTVEYHPTHLILLTLI